MGGLDFIHSFDDFWFFSNIFSSKSAILASVSDVETTQIDLNLDEASSSEPKPISIHVNSSTQQAPISEIGVHSNEIGPQMAKTEPIRIQDLTESVPRREERIRRKGSRKRNLKRNILREIDLGLSDGDCGCDGDDDENTGFDVNRVYGSWIVEEKCGSRRGGKKCGSENGMKKNMPPLNDGTAMKEHLKSWAYAVACSVK